MKKVVLEIWAIHTCLILMEKGITMYKLLHVMLLVSGLQVDSDLEADGLHEAEHADVLKQETEQTNSDLVESKRGSRKRKQASADSLSQMKKQLAEAQIKKRSKAEEGKTLIIQDDKG